MLTVKDLAIALGRKPTSEEEQRFSFLVVGAFGLINSYTGRAYTMEDPDLPEVVKYVALSMVARALTDTATAVAGVTQQQYTMGPFSQSTSFAVDSQGGGVWMTRQDRIMLAPYRLGVTVVETSSERY